MPGVGEVVEEGEKSWDPGPGRPERFPVLQVFCRPHNASGCGRGKGALFLPQGQRNRLAAAGS